jgi:DNA-binding transcriptional LysR family regulator
MNLRHLSVFVKVVEEGSFAAAARALSVPRSAVSQAVAVLEADLGVRLLHRSTRAMTLTDAGMDLHSKVAPALRTIAEAASSVSDHQGPLRGRVRLTAPVEVGARLLEPVLSRFLVAEPGVRIDLLLTTKTLDLVEHGIDLAVRGGPIADSELVARHLGAPQTAGLFASPQYLARRGTPCRLDQLCQHDAIAVRGQRGGWRLLGPRGAVQVSVPVRLEVDSFAYATRAACSGVGIAMLPTFLCEEERGRGQLARVLPGYAVEERPLWLVYPSKRNLSRAVAALRDALSEAFAASPTRRSRGLP